jgi:hypothetical protein
MHEEGETPEQQQKNENKRVRTATSARGERNEKRSAKGSRSGKKCVGGTGDCVEKEVEDTVRKVTCCDIIHLCPSIDT